MRRISWRDAIKRFGAALCTGCKADNTDCGELWIDESGRGPYCCGCAAKMAGAVDTARSVNQFYADTNGETVLVL